MSTHPLTERVALVAYGTETGNALDCAEEVGRTLERLRFEAHVLPLDDVDISTLVSFSLVILIVSTTGQGDLPANSRKFWRSLLRKKLPSDLFQDVEFTTFGLGDSSYPQYNWAVRKIHKRFLQLGAIESFKRGEADEQHEEGLDGAFVPWLSEFRTDLMIRFPLPSQLEALPEDELLPPKWLLSMVSTTVGDSNGTMSSSKNTEQYLEVTLRENRRMTPMTHWQDVRQMTFISNSNQGYEPGDVLTIYPQNSLDDVQNLITLMGWHDVSEKKVTLRPANSETMGTKYGRPPITALAESAMTTRQILTSHLDLNAIPRRSFFSLVSHFTEDQFHKERLQEFAKADYTDELFDYTTRPRRSILEVLQEFDTVKIPWQWAANVLPALRGRQFSIASGGKHKSAGDCARFDLLVAIVKYKTIMKKLREGVCTRYLANMPTDHAITVSLQKGSLGLSKSELAKPMVLVGPGTGIAPIRSILWQRLAWSQEAQGARVGEQFLIYGCRNEAADFFYRSEWDDLKSKVPLEIHAAFSRDQRQKVYVQDILKQQGRTIHRLLHDLEGTIFVCGSSGKMPTAVRAALAAVFRDCGSLSQGEAETYLETMERKGRYKQETWG